MLAYLEDPLDELHISQMLYRRVLRKVQRSQFHVITSDGGRPSRSPLRLSGDDDAPLLQWSRSLSSSMLSGRRLDSGALARRLPAMRPIQLLDDSMERGGSDGRGRSMKRRIRRRRRRSASVSSPAASLSLSLSSLRSAALYKQGQVTREGQWKG